MLENFKIKTRNNIKKRYSFFSSKITRKKNKKGTKSNVERLIRKIRGK